MLLKVSGIMAGLVTLLLSACAFAGLKQPNLKILPEMRPRWLAVSTWLYLTFAISGWAGFWQVRHSVSPALAAILTLVAVKFLAFFFAYDSLRHGVLNRWRENIHAMRFILAGSFLTGILILFAGSRL